MNPPPPPTSPPPDAAPPRHRFCVVYADPPWRGRGLPYPSMSTPAVCALPVQSLCAPDCALFLWATYPRLPDALAVTRAWGFRYVTVAFTWVKRTPRDTGFSLGMGGWSAWGDEIACDFSLPPYH